MKTALITGVSRGLGKALFEQLCQKKYYVFGLLKDPKQFEEWRQQVPANVELILADLAADDCIPAIRDVVQSRSLDLIINNAGIGGKEYTLGNIDTIEIQELFNIHCLGVVRVLKALEKNFSTHKNATILNINSRLGSINRQSLGTYRNLNVSYAYRIAKAAQNMLTNCLKQEFPEQTFVSLMPGKLKTGIAQTDADTSPAKSAARIIALWENADFVNENGINEVGKALIEW